MFPSSSVVFDYDYGYVKDIITVEKCGALVLGSKANQLVLV
jgi:hypothetical protein